MPKTTPQKRSISSGGRHRPCEHAGTHVIPACLAGTCERQDTHPTPLFTKWMCWLHRITALVPGSLPTFRIFVICLDVVHNAKLCNLASDELVAKILALIRSGHILGAQAGPPCETWSRAREVKIADKPSAPRPLRSAHQPWGLPSLRPKEYKQLQISNKLLQTALLVVAHLYACCGVTITEHPGEPSESRLPSIWRLAQVKWLCTLPGVEKGRIHQRQWGQTAEKPTDLLVTHLPGWERILESTKLPRSQWPAKERSIGHNGEAFCTSRLKEYPPLLCKAFAKCFLVSAQLREATQTDVAEIPSQSMLAEYANMPLAQEIGPDYAAGVGT